MRNSARSLLFVLLLVVPASAQWLKYPTPGIPRTADGKPDLNAPVPKGPDGKPDLTGLWMPSRRPGPTRVTWSSRPCRGSEHSQFPADRH